MADGDDYLTFLDSDDFVHIDYAKRMIELCEENGCGLAQCGYEKGSNDTFSDTSVDANIQVLTSNDALLGYRLKSLSCTKVYKVSTFNGVDFPVGVINEDEFVTYRVTYNANKVVLTDENLYYYFQHDTSIMDNVARKLKNNPRRHDYLKAYAERSEFFEQKNMPYQVMKAKEKICTDIILRYCEQMYLKKDERDTDCTDGTYMRLYRENYKLMIKRKGMPLKRKLMYIFFNIAPISGVIMGKIFTLRK